MNAPPTIEPGNNGKRTAEGPKKLRILLLEDSESDAELIVEEIGSAGLRFVARRTQSRDQFSRDLAEFEPHVILADYSLPDFSALEALSLLKEQGAAVPVILVTGSQSEEVAVQCMKQGAEDYILKQSLKRLPTAIVNVLERGSARREKEEAEAALRKSAEKFRLLFEGNPIPMFVYDVETLRFLEVNDAAVLHYGFSREEFARLWITDLWSLDDLRRLQNTRAHKHARLILSGDWVHQLRDGRKRNVYIVCRPLEMEQRNAELLIAQDITDRTQAEETLRQSREQLRALTAHLQSVREEERSIIAREIHDELGQILTAIQMDLAWQHEKLNHVPQPMRKALQAHTTAMADLIESSIRTVRRISTELRPEILDDLGLAAAIEWQAQEFRARTGIRCEFQSNLGDILLDRQRTIAVFRILQESLTNVVRHAQASKVRINLTINGNELVLEVNDDGIGIPDESISAVRSLGLLGMRERAALLGGNVSIQGKPKKGTTVRVKLPLPDPTTPPEQSLEPGS